MSAVNDPADVLDITDEDFQGMVTACAHAFAIAAGAIGEIYKSQFHPSDSAPLREALPHLIAHTLATYDIAAKRYVAIGVIAINTYARDEAHRMRLLNDLGGPSKPPSGAQLWKQIGEELRNTMKPAKPKGDPNPNTN